MLCNSFDSEDYLKEKEEQTLNEPDKCPCRKGSYKFGSALYAYYTCGHAYEKPLNSKETGNFLPQPYNPYKQ